MFVFHSGFQMCLLTIVWLESRRIERDRKEFDAIPYAKIYDVDMRDA